IFPDLNGPFTEIFGEYIELKTKYNSLQKSFKLLVYNSPQNKLSLEQAIDFYSNNNVNTEVAKAFIKLNIVKGLIDFIREKNGEYVKLSSQYLEIENKKRFLQSITDEIISQ